MSTLLFDSQMREFFIFTRCRLEWQNQARKRSCDVCRLLFTWTQISLSNKQLTQLQLLLSIENLTKKHREFPFSPVETLPCRGGIWAVFIIYLLLHSLELPKTSWVSPDQDYNFSLHYFTRKIYWPRGRVWGGSSSLNAMLYVRGHAFDYDRWESEGAIGWSYADCLPYFKKAQTHELGTYMQCVCAGVRGRGGLDEFYII